MNFRRENNKWKCETVKSSNAFGVELTTEQCLQRDLHNEHPPPYPLATLFPMRYTLMRINKRYVTDTRARQTKLATHVEQFVNKANYINVSAAEYLRRNVSTSACAHDHDNRSRIRLNSADSARNVFNFRELRLLSPFILLKSQPLLISLSPPTSRKRVHWLGSNQLALFSHSYCGDFSGFNQYISIYLINKCSCTHIRVREQVSEYLMKRYQYATWGFN